jgi:hypothetical protein
MSTGITRPEYDRVYTVIDVPSLPVHSYQLAAAFARDTIGPSLERAAK